MCADGGRSTYSKPPSIYVLALIDFYSAPFRTFFHLGVVRRVGSKFLDEVIHVPAIIGAVLLVLWLLGFTTFHVTSGFIHILLVLAVISVLLHFFRGRAAV